MANEAVAAICAIFLFSTLSSAAMPSKPMIREPQIPRKIPTKMLPANPFCPRDMVKLGVCLSLLGGAGSWIIGEQPGSKCCALLEGLTNAEAAVCLCTTIKESALGVTTKWSVAISPVLSSCKKEVPDGFKCV